MTLGARGKSWLDAADRLSLPAAVLAGIGLLALAGVLDWVTGPELASALFYLPAILWMTWKGDRRLGFVMVVACSATWLVISLLTHPHHANPFAPYWNALVRLATFSLVSGLQSEIIQRKRVELRLQQTNTERERQAGILESILNSMRDGVVVADSRGGLLHMNPAARRLAPDSRGRRRKSDLQAGNVTGHSSNGAGGTLWKRRTRCCARRAVSMSTTRRFFCRPQTGPTDSGCQSPGGGAPQTRRAKLRAE